MAKTATMITGFNVGGNMPLDQVGFVMKEILDRGGKLTLIEAAIEKVPILNGDVPHMLGTNGVTALLPAPDKPFSKLDLKRQQRVLAVMRKHAPAEAATSAISAAVRKHMSEFLVRKTLDQLTQSGAAKKSTQFGFWALTDVNGHPAPDATVAPAATKDQGKHKKEPTILKLVIAGGDNGASRKEIIAHLKAAGFTGAHWDHGPIMKLLEKKLIVPVKNTKGRWAATSKAKQQLQS